MPFRSLRMYEMLVLASKLYVIILVKRFVRSSFVRFSICFQTSYDAVVTLRTSFALKLTFYVYDLDFEWVCQVDSVVLLVCLKMLWEKSDLKLISISFKSI